MEDQRTIGDLKSGQKVKISGVTMRLSHFVDDSPVFVHKKGGHTISYHVKDYTRETLLTDIRR